MFYGCRFIEVFRLENLGFAVVFVCVFHTETPLRNLSLSFWQPGITVRVEWAQRCPVSWEVLGKAGLWAYMMLLECPTAHFLCFVLFCWSASICGAATAVPVLGIVQWGQNQVDSLTCTQAAPACSGNSSSAASISETLDLLTSVCTNKSIRLPPWERTRSKGCCYWWLRRWQFWVLWNEIRWITLDGVNKSQAAVSWAIAAFIFCAILLFFVHFLAVVNALCSRGAITSICNSMFLCVCSTWWSTLTCCLWIPMG